MPFSPLYVYRRGVALAEYFRKESTERRIKALIPKMGSESKVRQFVREAFIKEYDKAMGQGSSGLSSSSTVASSVALGGLVGGVPVSKPVGQKTIKPIKSKGKKVENSKKEAVKAGLFGSSASQANTNVILSGKSSPEVTIASLERAATDLEAGIAGATMADHLNLALTYEQFGKIQAHVSADGHISLKEIEDTIRKFNPSLSDALVAHCSALIAKEMHLASDKLYPVEVRDASPQAKAQIPSGMRKINFAKFAFVPLIGLLVWYFVFKKK